MPKSNALIETIVSNDPAVRNRSFESLCTTMNTAELLRVCEELDAFRRSATNLYERVRSTLFLYAACRFLLADAPEIRPTGIIPYEGFADLLERRFEQAIASFQKALHDGGPNSAILSALAEAYHHLSFQTLADQVRHSVRASRGNQWMFRAGHPEDHPLKLHSSLLQRSQGSLLFPILAERTPVRLDLSHSGWSDIFFLGMDYPEGARVLNISVDLGVYGRDDIVRPPVESYLRAIAEPVLRVTSIDLQCTKDISELDELFNFGNDYLSLVKAGIVASGLVPPAFEGAAHAMAELLTRLVGPGMGLEVVTKVNDIPKGSRLAVSTNLLASIVSLLMRATGQTRALKGTLEEDERRLVASRAILGEWLGGSGGGWQDSGGVWPGLKVIMGKDAGEFDPEWGVSKGCLLPQHRLLSEADLHPETTARIASSLVLLHGGMAQNVGPILEMVTERYLLRSEDAWRARQEMKRIFDDILAALKAGDMCALGDATTRNWNGPLKTIIPYVTNRFTETIIERARNAYGEDFWGFLMLGGMSGGGMAMFVAPQRRGAFRDDILAIMRRAKTELEDALPFAMDPVVYHFAINDRGTSARLLTGQDALMPAPYYALQVPELVKHDPSKISYLRRAELDHFTASASQPEETFSLLRTLVGNLFKVANPATQSERMEWDRESELIKSENGFDPIQHEQFRQDLRNGRIGLARNRLPVDTAIEDACDDDLLPLHASDAHRAAGDHAIREGRVAVLTLGGGVGSRWTTGAGVVKTVNPFIDMQGKHRSFLELHLAKTRKTATRYGTLIPHIVATSFLTHAPIQKHLALNNNYGFDGPLFLSRGMSITQRFIPMARDLVFLWEETAQETLDEQKQKVREATRAALLDWVRTCGEGADYTDNVPLQRVSPPGHWYEPSNLLRNGLLHDLLRAYPNIETLLLHNVDTLGADLDPAALGAHLNSGSVLTFEVVPRRTDDRGGGLARVNGRLRLLEGLAQPRDEDELRLRYYNSNTTWIQIDPFLALFGLTRADLEDHETSVAEAVRKLSARMPTYVTIKEVKRRWGHGQEDVYPVAQVEKIWCDMTALPDIQCGYLAVPRARGQQLKAPEYLDAWVNDGSKEYVESLCEFR